MQDVVVLQFGPYANYVGAHFWNCQERYRATDGVAPAVDGSVLYREGASTSYPRALVFDIRGSMGAVPLVGDEGEEEGDGAAGGRSGWPSFCNTRFHKRSLLEVGVPHSTVSLDHYSGGLDWAGMGPEGREALEEGARWHLEDSDYITGFMAIADTHNGFGGFAKEYLTYVREECPKQPIIVYGTSDPLICTDAEAAQSATGAAPSSSGVAVSAVAREAARDLDLSLSWAALAHEDISSVFVPLTLQSYADAVHMSKGKEAERFFPPSRRLDPLSPYHTSAVLAAAVNGTSLPWRQGPGGLGPVLEAGPSVYPSHTTLSAFVHSCRVFTRVPIAQASLSWDVPPCAVGESGDTSALAARLAAAPPLHTLPPPDFVPVSWACPLPAAVSPTRPYYQSVTVGGMARGGDAVTRLFATYLRGGGVHHQLLVSPADVLCPRHMDAPTPALEGKEGGSSRGGGGESGGASESKGEAGAEGGAGSEGAAAAAVRRGAPIATQALYLPSSAVLEWGPSFQPCVRALALRFQRHVYGGSTLSASPFLEHFTRSGALQSDDLAETKETLWTIVDMYGDDE